MNLHYNQNEYIKDAPSLPLADVSDVSNDAYDTN
jgi:hypothetical protein